MKVMGSKLVNSSFKEDCQMANIKSLSSVSSAVNKKIINLSTGALKSILELFNQTYSDLPNIDYSDNIKKTYIHNCEEFFTIVLGIRTQKVR